jgi:hypothetical protein
MYREMYRESMGQMYKVGRRGEGKAVGSGSGVVSEQVSTVPGTRCAGNAVQCGDADADADAPPLQVAMYQFLLTGMNDLKPLMAYVRLSEMDVPDLELCQPAKEVRVGGRRRRGWAEGREERR